MEWFYRPMNLGQIEILLFWPYQILLATLYKCTEKQHTWQQKEDETKERRLCLPGPPGASVSCLTRHLALHTTDVNRTHPVDYSEISMLHGPERFLMLHTRTACVCVHCEWKSARMEATSPASLPNVWFANKCRMQKRVFPPLAHVSSYSRLLCTPEGSIFVRRLIPQSWHAEVVEASGTTLRGNHQFWSSITCWGATKFSISVPVLVEFR